MQKVVNMDTLEMNQVDLLNYFRYGGRRTCCNKTNEEHGKIAEDETNQQPKLEYYQTW